MVPSVRFGSVIQVKEVFWNSLHPEETRWAGTSPEAAEHLLDYATGEVGKKFAQQLAQHDEDYRKEPSLAIMRDKDKGIVLLTGADVLANVSKRVFSTPPTKTATVEVAIPKDNEHHQFSPVGITFDA